MFSMNSTHRTRQQLYPHGGSVRFQGPFPRPWQDSDRAIVSAAIEADVRALRAGTCIHAADVEPAGEPRIVEYFDGDRDEYVVAWVIPCQKRRATTRASRQR
jgi:hypothetical protein